MYSSGKRRGATCANAAVIRTTTLAAMRRARTTGAGTLTARARSVTGAAASGEPTITVGLFDGSEGFLEREVVKRPPDE